MVVKMSGDGGEVRNEGLGDFKKRMKRFQTQNSESQLHQQQQVVNSSSSQSTSRSASTSSHSRISSSHSNLNELKSSMSEIKSDISEMMSSSSSVNNFTSRHANQSSSSTSTQQQQSSTSSSSVSKNTLSSSSTGFNKIKSSGGFKMDGMNGTAALMGSREQLAIPGERALQEQILGSTNLSNNPNSNSKDITFEESKVTSSSTTKVVKDNASYETAIDKSSESRKLFAGDTSFEQSSKSAAAKSKIEKDGITAVKSAAIQQDNRQMRNKDVTHRDASQVAGASMNVSGDGFSAHRSAISEQKQRQTITPAGTISQDSSKTALNSGLTITTKGICTKKSSTVTSSRNNLNIRGFEDTDVSQAILQYSKTMSDFVDQLTENLNGQLSTSTNITQTLDNIHDTIRDAWMNPNYGHELGSSLCDVLRHKGGLDILMKNCLSEDEDLKFNSAKVLEQCLVTDNRMYVVENGLENVVSVACDCTKNSVDHQRVGTGILEHLFKHSESTCSDIIQLGGLDAVLKECQKADSDIQTLRHCAGALCNLSLYGGTDNHQDMIKRNVASWLFPLAFHNDDNIKYYACLAIAALVANKEIEAAVINSDTLNLVEPFVSSHSPEQFAYFTDAHRHGQSKTWLQRLVPVLSSKREEARNLAAFHFCMEAGVKKIQNNLHIFDEIGAIEPLKMVASSPNDIASKYAAKALHLMGKEVPHKLSQQVPTWSKNDVYEWVKQIGFVDCSEAFLESKVDGDLLLQLNEDNLRNDIGIRNGILIKRFIRELRKLKKIADYSSCDTTGLNQFLSQLGPEFSEYTYQMLLAGISRDWLRYLTEEQLVSECGVLNSINRQKILNAIATDNNNVDKKLDIFISYRRSNGSQLASLLKVLMMLRGFTVFIDVERLEAGKFDNNLLNSIRQAKHFLLVLTANALDRCVDDTEGKDWVHREIVEAIHSNCNIIPIFDDFQWPDLEKLPDDMRSVHTYNGVKWIHDYQEACVNKVERFMRGEASGVPSDGALGRFPPGTPNALSRNPPLFARTTSIDSCKGSISSDRD